MVEMRGMGEIGKGVGLGKAVVGKTACAYAITYYGECFYKKYCLKILMCFTQMNCLKTT